MFTNQHVLYSTNQHKFLQSNKINCACVCVCRGWYERVPGSNETSELHREGQEPSGSEDSWNPLELEPSGLGTIWNSLDLREKGKCLFFNNVCFWPQTDLAVTSPCLQYKKTSWITPGTPGTIWNPLRVPKFLGGLESSVIFYISAT